MYQIDKKINFTNDLWIFIIEELEKKCAEFEMVMGRTPSYIYLSSQVYDFLNIYGSMLESDRLFIRKGYDSGILNFNYGKFDVRIDKLNELKLLELKLYY